MKSVSNICSALVFFVFVPVAIAQPATFDGTTLTLPHVVIPDADNPAAYADIELIYEGDTVFRLNSEQGQQINLAMVESVSVSILESFPVQVEIIVIGNKSVPCVELVEPSITRQESLFVVVLAETVLGPEESCIAVLDPFETTFPLDVLNLLAGNYIVRVNGVDAEFTLEIDNIPAGN